MSSGRSGVTAACSRVRLQQNLPLTSCGSENAANVQCCGVKSAEAYAVVVVGCTGNFPVDKWGVGYRTLWNTFKIIAKRMGLSEEEKAAIFHDTAARVYSV